MTASAAVGAAAPFDLDAVMEQVHSAYRPADELGHFSGGHATYSVEVDLSGATLRPFHRPRHYSDPTGAPEPRPRTGVVEGAPIRLELLGIERGGRPLAQSGAGVARVAQDGHLEIARASIVEHYRNRDEGVEQSWSFARKPEGTGELRVRMRAGGLAYVGTTDTGLHFADASTGLGFRYGHGTWVDAEGTATPVLARYVAGEIELVVPSRVLEESAYPAVLDPTISPELGTDEPVVVAFGGGEEPAVASNGTDYLVVWQDVRNMADDDIYGARVSPSGVVLDPTGILISRAPGDQDFPQVASDGTDYLVVWQDHRGGSNGDVYGARVSAVGVVLDPMGIAISTRDGDQRTPGVASNGSGYLVAWFDYDFRSYRTYAARVSSSGELLDPAGFVIANGGYYSPRVASNGTDYLVVWHAGGLRAARVSGAGSLLDAVPILISTTAGLVYSVASDGTDYLVVWSDRRDGRQYDVYGARVTRSGVVLDPDGIPISARPSSEWRPSVASNGTDYLVVWRDSGASILTYDIHAARISRAGAVLDPGGIVLAAGPDRQENVGVASNGTGYLVVWQDERGRTPPGVVGTRVGSAGEVLDPSGFVISRTINAQWHPSLASNGVGYLVVWRDLRRWPNGDLYGVRISRTGAILDPSGILITTTADSSTASGVASDGADYFVVWNDTRNAIYGARVSGDGLVLDPDAVLVTPGASWWPPGVASNGIDYFVAWQEVSFYNPIYGRRVSRDGVMLDPGPLTIAAETSQGPSVASDGAGYAVVWGLDRIRATRVSAGGAVLDPAGIPLSTAFGARPSVASSGADYLAAWQTSTFGATDVHGARFSSGGSVLDPAPIAISTAADEQSAPSVESSGADYLVAWRDRRSGATYDIYGTRVRDGVVDVPAGIALAADPETSEGEPRMASGPEGMILLTYHRFVPEVPFGVVRARARLIRMDGERGDPCSADAECWGGFCADGVCCDSPCGGGPLDCQACAVAAGAAIDGTCGPASGSACTDGRGCTASDVCEAGVCVGGGDPCRSETMCSEEGEAYACSACPAGTASADGTGATECEPCEPGTFSGAGATRCLSWTSCDPGAHVMAEGSSTSDRACAACAAGTYSSVANAASCEAWTDCEPGAYVSVLPSAVRDRGCEPCSPGAYSTELNAASCDAWTPCSPGEHIASIGSPMSDRACAPCPPDTFASVANASACRAWRSCRAGEYEAAAPTATSDRACTACTRCEVGAREVAPCSETRDTVCERFDASMAMDGGIADAAVDASVEDASVEPGAGAGCGCRAGGASSGGQGIAWLALMGLVARRRRAIRSSRT